MLTHIVDYKEIIKSCYHHPPFTDRVTEMQQSRALLLVSQTIIIISSNYSYLEGAISTGIVLKLLFNAFDFELAYLHNHALQKL